MGNYLPSPNTSAVLKLHGMQKSIQRDSVHGFRRKNAGIYGGVFLGRTWKIKKLVLSVASPSSVPRGTATTHFLGKQHVQLKCLK